MEPRLDFPTTSPGWWEARAAPGFDGVGEANDGRRESLGFTSQAKYNGKNHTRNDVGLDGPHEMRCGLDSPTADSVWNVSHETRCGKTG
jgi:hypothetical protein